MKGSVLIIHRYFYPDTPAYAVMLRRIGKALVEDGYKVDVLTSMPSYYGSTKKGVLKKQVLDGMEIKRFRLLPEKNRNFLARSINSLLFAFLVGLEVLKRKSYNLITIATTPPVIMAFIVRITSGFKKSSYIYHCQDIYPEIVIGNKNLKSKSFFNILKAIDRRNNAAALTNIVLSVDMRNTLMKQRGIHSNKISIINNFIRIETQDKLSFSYKEFGIPTESYKVVFCGNIGKLQNLSWIIEAAKKMRHLRDMKFIFMGEGIEKNSLISLAGELLNDTIFFTGYISSDKVFSALEQADLGVISISESTYKTAYPSKTMTYLNAGLPLLAVMNKEAELSEFILKNDLGIIAKPNDLDSIMTALQNGYDKRRNDKARIREIAQQEFSEKVILKKWQLLFNRLILST